MIRFIHIWVLLVSLHHPLFAQQFKRSEPGMLFPAQKRPVLEARLEAGHDLTNMLFAGARITLRLVIYNTGNVLAEDCWIKVDSDNPHLFANVAGIGLFSIEPEQSFTINLPIEVRANAPKGRARLIIDIQEMNGYGLSPPRSVLFFIDARPKAELVVVDYAIKDQAGVGYFGKFENVELFFKVQNCSDRTFTNVHAYLETLPGTVPVSVNPQLNLGDMHPGDTKELYSRVTTDLTATNIGIAIKINSGDYVFDQTYYFDFLTDYKTPEMMPDDGCDAYYPSLTSTIIERTEGFRLPPRPIQSDRIAIIVSNGNYHAFDNIEYAQNDANAFVHFLINQHGYRKENILIMSDMFLDQMRNLTSLSGVEGRQLIRLLRGDLYGKEITFFYVGYAAADLVNGEILLLPVNFSVYMAKNSISISALIDMFDNLKSLIGVRQVKCYLNVKYALVSGAGILNDHEMEHAKKIEQTPWISLFLSSSVRQNSGQVQSTEVTEFTQSLIRGLTGEACFDHDRIIRATELNSFLSDEIIGIPAMAREERSGFKVPVYMGGNNNLY